VYPDPSKLYVPSSASAYEIELLEQEGIIPLLSDLRLDWTFESVRWNGMVFSILAEELREWLEKERLPPVKMKHVRALAKEDGFGDNTSGMLEDRVKKTLKNQEKSVQHHWDLQVANAAGATRSLESSMMDSTLEKAMARMRSRRRGVRFSTLEILIKISSYALRFLAIDVCETSSDC
jgi:hypothetical protein